MWTMKCKICKQPMKSSGFHKYNERHYCFDCNLVFIPFSSEKFNAGLFGKWVKLNEFENGVCL